MLVAMVIVQWVFILVLLVAVVALAQQVGLLHSRLGPVGARVVPVGPGIGEKLPAQVLDDIGGTEHAIGGDRDQPQLIVFLSTNCSSCVRLAPGLRAFVRDEGQDLDIVLAFLTSDASMVAKFVRENRLHGPVVIRGTELPHAFRVSNAPFAVLLGQQGVVMAKGVVNTREQLDSLLSDEAIESFANLAHASDREPVTTEVAVGSKRGA